MKLAWRATYCANHDVQASMAFIISGEQHAALTGSMVSIISGEQHASPHASDFLASNALHPLNPKVSAAWTEDPGSSLPHAFKHVPPQRPSG